MNKSNNTEFIELNQSFIQKENSCQIEFKKNPTNINDTKNIMDCNSNEECEIFTAFNNNNNVGQPKIAWVTKMKIKKSK